MKPRNGVTPEEYAALLKRRPFVRELQARIAAKAARNPNDPEIDGLVANLLVEALEYDEKTGTLSSVFEEIVQ